MGQSNSNSLQQKQLLKQYHIKANLSENDTTFLVHRQTAKQYLLTEFSYNSNKQLEAISRQLQKRKLFSSNYTTNITKIQNQRLDSMCSKIYKIHILWQFSSTTLAHEINKRGLQRNPFSKQQLINLFSSMVKGLFCYQQKEIAYQCLSTKSIIQYSNSYKVVDPMLMMRTNIESVLKNRNIKNIYLSPSQCKLIQQDAVVNLDNGSHLVFTVGMIVLESALLERQSSCYVNNCSDINWTVLQANISRVEQRYGWDIRKLLDKMLTKYGEFRISLEEVNRCLNELTEKEVSISSSRKDSNCQSAAVQTNHLIASIAEKVQSRKINQHHYLPSNNNCEKLTQSQKMGEATNVQYAPGRLIQTAAYLRNSTTESQVSTHKPVMLNEMKTIIINKQFPSSISESPFSELATTAKNNYILTTVTENQSMNSMSKLSPFIKMMQNNETEIGQNVSTNELSQLKINKYGDKDKPVNNVQMKYYLEQFKLGSRYQGYKSQGKREGWGQFYFEDGGKYEGQWRDNKMDGFGKLYYQSGHLAYEGNWHMHQFHGKGKLYNQNPAQLHSSFNYRNFDSVEDYWVSFEGTFDHDQKNGIGKLLLSNGEFFEGSFVRDQIDGEGSFITNRGQKIEGHWKKNILTKITSKLTNY